LGATSITGSAETTRAVNPAPVHVLLSAELFHPDLPGGLMRFFRYGPGLRERGILPEVITLRHRSGLAAEEEINGIRIHRLTAPNDAPGERQRVWLLRQALARALAIRRRGGRAVLQPGMLAHTMAPTLLRARLAGIPCVHNLTLAPESPLKTRGLARLRQRLRMTLMCAPVARFVFLSHQLRRQYQERWPLRPNQIEVIANGVDLARFRPAADPAERRELRSRHGLGHDAKIVLFVGGIMERKGIDILLEAWNGVRQQHADAVLLILGSQAGRVSHERDGFKHELQDYLRRIDDLRARLNHPDSVRFLGEVADPAPLYRLADVFAFPSRREGLPNAVLEAMASSLPCLVADFDGRPQDGEELGTAGTHYLPLDHQPATWTAALAEILRDEASAQRLEMGRQARTWMSSHHELSHVLDAWERLYREHAQQT
jgi:glycosyltransferase involved in cell wall biosynthesis